MLRQAYTHLRTHGPLGAARRTVELLHWLPGSTLTYRLLCGAQAYLDGAVDRRYGIDTSGVNQLSELTVRGDNAAHGNWYEGASAKHFRQIMASLDIDCSNFQFIDFGSGKGRVLFLALDYGFAKIIGVEFAEELHHAAVANVVRWESRIGKRSNIEPVCMDAAHFPIPSAPLVIFIFGSFRVPVMERVLTNVQVSMVQHPREIVLVYYGHNASTIELLKSTPGFDCTELSLRPDWTRFYQSHRALVFRFRVSASTLKPATRSFI